MSCYIVEADTVQTIATFISDILNHARGCNEYRLSFPNSIYSAFEECKTKDYYDTHKIYRKLYIMNLVAWNARYNEQAREFPKYGSGHAERNVQEIYKHIQTYLYQCSEGSNFSSPLYLAISQVFDKVAHALVSNICS